jgi:hypothetical protein
MVWQGFETGDDKTQQPLETHLDRTANAAKRDAFQQQTLNEITGFIRDEVLLEAIDKLATTGFALMILFAVVNVTVLLICVGLAARTDVSDDHTHGELLVLSQRFE